MLRATLQSPPCAMVVRSPGKGIRGHHERSELSPQPHHRTAGGPGQVTPLLVVSGWHLLKEGRTRGTGQECHPMGLLGC